MSHAGKPKPTGRAVITFGRSCQALAAAQSLGRHGVEVTVCDDAPMMAAQFSRYVKGKFIHPPAKENPEQFLDVLEENLRKFKPDDDIPYVLMPIHEQTRLIAEHRKRFESLAHVSTPRFEAIDQVDPKNKLTATAERLNLPIPRTWQVGGLEELDRIMSELQFPVFLKLPHTSGGIGLHRVESEDDLRSVYKEVVSRYQPSRENMPLVQQAVGGDDYCVSLLLQEGKVKAHMTYRNVKSYPWSGGSGAIRETVEAALLIDLSTQLLGPLSWDGMAQVDFRWDGKPDGDAWLIEVNPRFFGGLFQSIESRVDYPWLLFQLVATGQVAEVVAPVVGTRTQVPVFGMISALKDIDMELFNEMKDLGDDGWARIKGGAVGEGLGLIAKGLGKGLSLPDRIKRLNKFLSENRNARTEILSTEDPLASLGILFGFASLIHNGTLPEQMRR